MLLLMRKSTKGLRNVGSVPVCPVFVSIPFTVELVKSVMPRSGRGSLVAVVLSTSFGFASLLLCYTLSSLGTKSHVKSNPNDG